MYPYVQVAGDLRRRVHDGALKPGQPVPLVADIARAAGVSRQTVSRALCLLKREGLITRGPGSIYHVTGARGAAVPPLRSRDDTRRELDASRALEALRWCWGEVYEIWIDPGMGLWLARRTGGTGIIIEGGGPGELRARILEDWPLHPAALRR